VSTATITKEFTFSAAHHLTGLRPDHPCSRVHGHNYVVTLTLTGDLDHNGFVIDYNDLAPVGAWIDGNLDHHDLNHTLNQPTAENLAQALVHIVDDILDLSANRRIHRWSVTVSETPKTTATVTGLRSMERDL
jgi:6-pyruvoyltetrahydropterin/6-carboxytetrahydropterin synthase